MTLAEFKKRFKILKSKGWVCSARKGPTGVGHTLEKEIGLSENNIALPDIDGKAELKAHRINSNSKITLFTFNRSAWEMNPLDAVKKYGTKDGKGRLGLYFQMSQIPNSSGLFIDFNEKSFCVMHKSGEVLARWQFDNIAKRFREKLPILVLVGAFSEMRGSEEFFKFDRAQVMENTSANTVANQLKSGNILVDLRMHDKGTMARNHGTGFRAYEGKLHMLFNKVEDLQ